MNEKKGTIKVRFSTAILIIIIVILAGFIAYLEIDRGQSQTVVKVDEPIEEIDKVANEEVIETEPTNVATETPNATRNLYHFNPNNGKNVEEDTEYIITKTIQVEGDGVCLSLNSKNEVEVEVYENDPSKNLDDDFSYVKGMKRKIGVKEIVKGFNGKVDEIFIAEMGQDITGTTILFLMEDGTVEYIVLRDLMQTTNLASRGKVEGLNNIVKLENVELRSYVNETDWTSGGTTVAIDNTGAFYNIGTILSDMNLDWNKVN